LPLTFELVAADDLAQIDVQQALLLAIQLGQSLLQRVATRLESLGQPFARLRPPQLLCD
jgi:hypothetical protein